MKRPRFHVYKARSSVPMKPEWRWRLIAANGRILASGEAHTRKADAERAVRAVMKAVKSLLVHQTVNSLVVKEFGKPFSTEAFDAHARDQKWRGIF